MPACARLGIDVPQTHDSDAAVLVRLLAGFLERLEESGTARYWRAQGHNSGTISSSGFPRHSVAKWRVQDPMWRLRMSPTVPAQSERVPGDPTFSLTPGG